MAIRIGASGLPGSKPDGYSTAVRLLEAYEILQNALERGLIDARMLVESSRKVNGSSLVFTFSGA